MMYFAKARTAFILAIVAAVSSVGTPAAMAVSWVEQGPGPSLFGASEGIPDNPVAGAINAIAIDPTNADVIYLGTVNGGVWKTTHGTAASPVWIPLTDATLPALSINSLAISPVDTKLLFAGTGSTSSNAGLGSPGFGVARSKNGGKSWDVLADATFAGRRINSIVPTMLDKGNVVLAATLRDNGGVYRSTDMGKSFTRLSGDGLSGLPDQGVSSLVADPGDPMRFYAAVPRKTDVGATGDEGLYRSVDGGATWVDTGLAGLATASRILLSVHNNSALSTNAVYAMIIDMSNRLQGVFRSADHGATWASMAPLPTPPIFPGGQGSVHGAIVAHATDPDVVFISGDRQDTPFPNANGCTNYSGNVFRGNATTSAWENVVCNGAAGTSPHADSRAMVFDASGNIMHACDGGLFRLADPDVAASRRWSSVNGDLRQSEIHSVAYDPLSRIVFGGTQDNGTPIQSAPGARTWDILIGADGGKVAVDADQTAHPGTSIRYTSFQYLGYFNRTTWDAANALLSGPTPLVLEITSGGSGYLYYDTNIQFYNPYVLNAIDPARMLIGTANLYESMDKGDSLANLGFQSQYITALAYGGRLDGVAKPDVFYVGTAATTTLAARVLHRVNVGDSISELAAYPGSSVRSLVMDPQNYRRVFVLDNLNRVWASLDEGVTWTELTADLPKLSSDVRVLEFFNPGGKKDNSVLIAGGLGGVFQMKDPAAAKKPKWDALSKDLPNGLVLDLHYDYTDNVLVAGILGRGAWTLTGFFPGGK